VFVTLSKLLCSIWNLFYEQPVDWWRGKHSHQRFVWKKQDLLAKREAAGVRKGEPPASKPNAGFAFQRHTAEVVLLPSIYHTFEISQQRFTDLQYD